MRKCICIFVVAVMCAAILSGCTSTNRIDKIISLWHSGQFLGLGYEDKEKAFVDETFCQTYIDTFSPEILFEDTYEFAKYIKKEYISYGHLVKDRFVCPWDTINFIFSWLGQNNYVKYVAYKDFEKNSSGYYADENNATRLKERVHAETPLNENVGEYIEFEFYGDFAKVTFHEREYQKERYEWDNGIFYDQQAGYRWYVTTYIYFCDQFVCAGNLDEETCFATVNTDAVYRFEPDSGETAKYETHSFFNVEKTEMRDMRSATVPITGKAMIPCFADVEE